MHSENSCQVRDVEDSSDAADYPKFENKTLERIAQNRVVTRFKLSRMMESADEKSIQLRGFTKRTPAALIVMIAH